MNWFMPGAVSFDWAQRVLDYVVGVGQSLVNYGIAVGNDTLLLLRDLIGSGGTPL